MSERRSGAGGGLQRLEDPADRGRTNPVAELEQLALDPLVSPAVVLGGELLDKGGDELDQLAAEPDEDEIEQAQGHG